MKSLDYRDTHFSLGELGVCFPMEFEIYKQAEGEMLEYRVIPQTREAQRVGADAATSPLPNGPQRIAGTCLPNNLVPDLLAKGKPSKSSEITPSDL